MTAFSLKLKLTLIHLELCNACAIVYQTVLFPKTSKINKALNMSLVVYPKVKINGHKNRCLYKCDIINIKNTYLFVLVFTM